MDTDQIIMERKKSSGFFPITGPRGVTLTSLDNYTGDVSQEPRQSLLKTDTTEPNNDQSETIASLQKEQQRLSEELAAERRRSESLKATFTASLSQEASEQRKRLLRLRNILEADSDNPAVKEALRFIGNVEVDDKTQPRAAPHFQELAEQAKSAEETVARQHEENQKLKSKIREVMAERDGLIQQLEDLNAQIEATAESRHEIKTKLKTLAANYKKKEADWKERVATLEAQIESQEKQ